MQPFWVGIDCPFSGSIEGTEGILANQVIVESTKVTPWQQNCHNIGAVRQ